MDIAALTALIAGNPIAAGIVAVVLVLLGIKNKDKIADLWAKITGKTDGAAGDVKAKASAIGDKVTAKFEDVIGDVAGIAGAIDSSALMLGTLALRQHYLNHVAVEDVDAVNVAFQSLQNINAKLPVVKPTA